MLRSAPLARVLVPHTALWQVLLAIGGSLFVALTAQVAVPLPFSPVPVTGQTFGVLLVAAALGARLGVATLVLYVLEGLAGLPVFAPGSALGLARLLGPTGGYLIGFVAAAALVGWLAQRGWDRTPRRSIAAMLAGDAVIFACGLLWLARFVPLGSLATAGLLPFLPGELVKIALAAAALPLAWRLVR